MCTPLYYKHGDWGKQKPEENIPATNLQSSGSTME